MRGRALIAFAAMAGVVVACESITEADIEYNATLVGASEVPPVTTTGTGSFSATLDDDDVLHYTLAYEDLSSNVTMAHIHGPAAAGVIAGIIIDFSTDGRTLVTGATSGDNTGTIDLKIAATSTISGDSLRKLLDNGNAYVNVHTVNNGGGEIRGQVVRQ